MANPYYIQPPQSGVVSGIKTLGGLADIYQRGKQSAQRNKLAAKELEQRGRISDRAHERGMRGLEIQEQGVQQAARRNDLTEAGLAQAERQTAPHQQNFGLSKVYSLRGIFKQKGIELDSVMKPVTDHMEKLAKDPNVNNQTAYMDLKQNYPAYREQVMENIGKEMEKILSDDIPNTMQTDRIQKLQGLMQDFEQDREGKIVDAVFGPTRRAVAMEDMEKEAALAKAMPEQFGPRTTDQYGNVLQQNLQTGEWEKITGPPSGMSLEMGEDGTVKFRQGAGAGQAGLERGTKKGLEEKIVNAQEGMARLRNIAQEYQKPFLQTGQRVKNAWTSLKDKLQGSPLEQWVGKVSPEEKQNLEEYSRFRQVAMNNLNDYIREITGAQMNKDEAKRLTKAMPNPGQGVFDGDSPTEFEAKYNRVMETLNLANARYIYYLKTAPDKLESGEIMSMDRFKNRMADREEELREAGLGNEEIAAKLNEEFFSLGQ